MRKLSIGELVIRGEGDAPCEQTVSRVVSIEGDIAMVQYVARRLRKHTSAELRKPNPWGVDALIPVSEFGVEWELLTNSEGEPYLKFTQTSESKTTYRDGVPRRWQPSSYGCVLEPKFARYFRCAGTEVKPNQ